MQTDRSVLKLVRPEFRQSSYRILSWTCGWRTCHAAFLLSVIACCVCQNEAQQSAGKLPDIGTGQHAAHWNAQMQFAFQAIHQFHGHQRVEPQMGQRRIAIDLRSLDAKDTGDLFSKEIFDDRSLFSGVLRRSPESRQHHQNGCLSFRGTAACTSAAIPARG